MKLKTKKIIYCVFYYLICSIYISMTAFASSEILDVQIYNAPGRPSWCWAASGSSVLYHYGIPVTESQICNFVNQTFGRSDCCTPGYCNTGAEFGDVAYTLEYYQYFGLYAGILSDWLVNPGWLSWSEVQQAINSGRPFMIGWENGPEGHAVVGTGYNTWGTGYVWYMDPNEDVLQANTYTWMKSNPEWTWVDSLKMTSNPPATVCRADLDGDLEVEIFDLMVMRNEYGTNNCNPSSQQLCCKADCDGNGEVEIFDLLIMKEEYARGPSSGKCRGRTPPCSF